MHLWATEGGATQPENTFEKLPAPEFPYFCILMLHLTHKSFQIKAIFAGIVTFCFMISACTGNKKQDDVRSYMSSCTDTLWLELNQVKKMFGYKTAEISERARLMDSILQRLKFADPSRLSSQDMSKITQYTSIQRIYKGFGPKYTECVVNSEELFFDVKALEKAVKQGKYDSKLKDFKSEYGRLRNKLREVNEETTLITDRINTVEPTFQRISTEVEKLTGRE